MWGQKTGFFPHPTASALHLAHGGMRAREQRGISGGLPVMAAGISVVYGLLLIFLDVHASRAPRESSHASPHLHPHHTNPPKKPRRFTATGTAYNMHEVICPVSQARIFLTLACREAPSLFLITPVLMCLKPLQSLNATTHPPTRTPTDVHQDQQRQQNQQQRQWQK